MKVKRELSLFWNWLWKSESIWSYIVFLILIFIIVKFVFLPGLSLAFGMGPNGLPLAIVESSSMEHYALSYCISYDQRTFECLQKSSDYEICGKEFNNFQSFNLDEYWQICGNWYEDNFNITKEQFSEFELKRGFRKGDLMVIMKRKINIGDVIVFNAGKATPLIHRVVSLEPLQTKGDHNSEQLTSANNIYNLDETEINENQVIGTAVLRIPYLGWVKLFFVELLRKIF